MQIKAILWDMDGVLVDSGPDHFAAWQAVLDQEGIPFDEAAFRRTFGMHNRQILELLTGGPVAREQLERISAAKEARYRQQIAGRAQALPGVREWLAHGQARGLRMAVASGAPPENIEFTVDQLGIREYFLALVSAFDLPGKPHPAVFLEAARQVGVPPQGCLVIEDSVAGVQAARRGGMRCLAVTNTHPAAALAAADWVVDSLAGPEAQRLRLAWG